MFFNTLKTIILLTVLSGLLIFLGGIVGGTDGIYISLVLSIIMNGIAYFFSDKIVLKMYRARPLEHTQFPEIYETVAELTKKMNIPMPKLWIIDTPMANAFATGRNPSHASVAVTTGILSLLDHEELRGVLAHELGHIKNRDILVTTIAATLATAIGYLAYMLRHLAFWGSFRSNRRRGGNVIVMFFVGLLIPLAATLVQLAISRSREYLADETGAHTCQDPLALASALQKLHQNVQFAHLSQDETQRASTASLFIVYPFINSSWVSLFSTHPPMHKRIARLEQVYKKMFS